MGKCQSSANDNCSKAMEETKTRNSTPWKVEVSSSQTDYVNAIQRMAWGSCKGSRPASSHKNASPCHDTICPVLTHAEFFFCDSPRSECENRNGEMYIRDSEHEPFFFFLTSFVHLREIIKENMQVCKNGLNYEKKKSFVSYEVRNFEARLVPERVWEW